MNGTLFGHGVMFSPFSGSFQARQVEWLKLLEKETSIYKFRHITEHFGSFK